MNVTTRAVRFMCAALAVALTITASAAPIDLFPILPTDVVREALRWQTLGAVEQVPTATLLVVLAEPIGTGWIERMTEAGYVIEGRFDPFLVVSAPITLFIDSERGLDALALAASALPAFENWTNLAPPSSPILTEGRPLVATSWLIGESRADRGSAADRLLRGLRRMR